MKSKIALTLLAISWAIAVSAQKTPDSLLIGTWKGTSLCQIKTSPCHDEQVIYHISRGDSVKEFKVLANKIIQGVEADMGILIGTFNEKESELIISPKPNTIWTFKMTGQKMEGTLFYNKALYRIVSLTKTK